jgi:hypothetical protein
MSTGVQVFDSTPLISTVQVRDTKWGNDKNLLTTMRESIARLEPLSFLRFNLIDLRRSVGQ